MNKLLRSLPPLLVFGLVPSSASAITIIIGGSGGDFSDFSSALYTLADWIDQLLPFLIGLAVLYFFWGLTKFVLHAAEEDAREDAKKIMVWGTVAVFIMVSLWGLIGFLSRTFNLRADPSAVISAPTNLRNIVPR